MADFTIPTFLAAATAGMGVAIMSTPSATSNNIVVGCQPLTVVGTADIDLGNYFTATQVLESYTLRAGIISGQIRAYAGTVSLAKTF